MTPALQISTNLVYTPFFKISGAMYINDPHFYDENFNCLLN